MSIFHVSVAPVVNEHPANTNVTVTGQLQLMCSFMGFPPPMITWYHNGSMLYPNERILILENDTESRTTQGLMSVIYTTYADSGEYMCSGTNNASAGAVFTTPAWILVQGKVIFLYSYINK